MKLKVKYIFPTLTSGVNFYIYKLPEGLGIKKKYAHGTRMQKNFTIQGGYFSRFSSMTHFGLICKFSDQIQNCPT